jgi:hypothetical protein
MGQVPPPRRHKCRGYAFFCFIILMLINGPKGGPCYRVLPASLKLVSRASMSCAAGEVAIPILPETNHLSRSFEIER